MNPFENILHTNTESRKHQLNEISCQWWMVLAAGVNGLNTGVLSCRRAPFHG